MFIRLDPHLIVSAEEIKEIRYVENDYGLPGGHVLFRDLEGDEIARINCDTNEIGLKVMDTYEALLNQAPMLAEWPLFDSPQGGSCCGHQPPADAVILGGGNSAD